MQDILADASLLGILKECSSSGNLQKGRRLHACIMKNLSDCSIFVGNTLIDMYAKCGCIDDAHRVFDTMQEHNVVSWTAMISGYAKLGFTQEALQLQQQMQQQGARCNELTFLAILQAYAEGGSLEHGKRVHVQIGETGLRVNLAVSNSLISMYAKCGCMIAAQLAFDKATVRDTVSWNALIAGYVQQGPEEEAVKLYNSMDEGGVKPDKITFSSMLTACGGLLAVEQGKRFHNDIIKLGIDANVEIGNTLINMYVKFGTIAVALQILESMPSRNVVSWSTMIAGYAQHGCGMEALHLLEQMQHEDIAPDHIALVSVLSACSHAGLVDYGFCMFVSIIEEPGISLTDEHYVCMVDLVGRAGRLDEAEKLIKKMKLQPSADVWRAFLGACRIHGNERLTKHAAEQVLMLDPQDTATSFILANLSCEEHCTRRSMSKCEE